MCVCVCARVHRYLLGLPYRLWGAANTLASVTFCWLSGAPGAILDLWKMRILSRRSLWHLALHPFFPLQVDFHIPHSMGAWGWAHSSRGKALDHRVQDYKAKEGSGWRNDWTNGRRFEWAMLSNGTQAQVKKPWGQWNVLCLAFPC